MSFSEQLADCLEDRIRQRLELQGRCWVWTGATNKDGYGIIKAGSRTDGSRRHWLVHRYVWTCLVGPISEGMGLLHDCDNPACCNPYHLYEGTPIDNVRDREDRGRRILKITREQAEEIRQRYSGRYSERKQLAEEYGVSGPSIHNIVTRRTHP